MTFQPFKPFRLTFGTIIRGSWLYRRAADHERKMMRFNMPHTATDIDAQWRLREMEGRANDRKAIS